MASMQKCLNKFENPLQTMTPQNVANLNVDWDWMNSYRNS